MERQQVKYEDDPLLNEKEAAVMLDLAVGTLQVWRSARRYPLAYVRVGRSIKYRRSSILEFIASRTVAA